VKAIRNISYGIPYQNAQGESKWRSVPCGTLFYDEQEKRFSIKLEALPVAPRASEDDGVWLNCWPIEKRDGQGQGGGQRQQRQDTVIEDIGDEPINLDDVPF
jgi:hypothetical protein